MAEEEESRGIVTGEDKDVARDIESRIKVAMRSRVNHFKEQADSLTFEGVRRLLEKDMGLKEYALDVHKRFVKQCLSESLDGAVDDNTSKGSGDTRKKHNGSVKVEPAELRESRNIIKETEDEEKMEDSPVMGLLTAQKAKKSNNSKTGDDENKEFPSESIIKRAIWKRASYIKANAEEITMAGLRRTLEQDLGLDKFTLDPHKKFISKELDEVLKSSEVSEPGKKATEKKSSGKAPKKARNEESLGSSDKSDEEDEAEAKPKKKPGPERQVQKTEGSKKRKLEKETTVSRKRVKPEETGSNSCGQDSGNDSEDSRSQSAAKAVKRKEAPTPAYGKHVEHLKSVIKLCGMSIPPVVYKKVKQVPESKREGELIKELEEILSREGLSSNPSEKEIKEVRRRKERAKELEGIDMSNIVATSRRRSTTSFIPPKPKIPVEKSDDDDSADTDDEDDDDDEDEDEDDDDGNAEEDGDNDGDDESQSEEVNEEHADDSD